MVIVPRVVISGGTLTSLIKKAFNAPTPQDISNVRNTAVTGFSPTSTMSFAQTTLTSDNKEPTDRSIPPARITKVIPTADIPSIAT